MENSTSARSAEWPAPRGWWSRTFAIAACWSAAAGLLVIGVTQAVDGAHADEIRACERLGGEIVNWYECLSPDGQIVDPID